MAMSDSVCSERAVLVTSVPDESDLLQAAGSAVYLIGHTLGMGHTGAEDCLCEDPEGCIMDSPNLCVKGKRQNTFAN